MQNTFGMAGIKGNISNLDVEEKFDLLLESNDIFLDRAVSFFDRVRPRVDFTFQHSLMFHAELVDGRRIWSL